MANSQDNQSTKSKGQRLWQQLSFRDRLGLELGIDQPQTKEQAQAVLAYARRLRRQQPLMSLAGSAGFMLVWLGLGLAGGGLSDLVWAQAVAGGVSFGLANYFISRVQANRLRRAGQNYFGNESADEAE